jgi:hypothetical protein
MARRSTGELAKVAEACIVGAHARQAMSKGFSGPTWADAELEALDRRFLKLISGDLSQVEPILAAGVCPPDDAPARVVEKLLAGEAPAASRADIKAMTSLCQMSVEMNRDGTVLQDLYKFLDAQGLAVAYQQIGLVMDEAMAYRLAEAMSRQVGKCPYDVSVKMCALTFIKTKMWGERVSGIITAATYARELERGPLAPYLPAIRAMRPMKICVLGHSFASHIH